MFKSYIFPISTAHKNNYSASQLRDFQALFDGDLQKFEEASLLTKAVEIKENNVYTI